MDSAEAVKTWEELSKAIDEIYNQNASQLAFEEVYRRGYNLVMKKHGDLLFEGLTENLRRHLKVSSAILSSTSSEFLLEATSKEWNAHKVAFGMISAVLMYMDRSYCKNSKKPVVMDLALQLFREEVINASTAQRIRLVLLEQIALERAGCIIDRDMVRVIVNMLLALVRGGASAYHEEFEEYFLIETERYYRQESLQLVSSSTCAEYIHKVDLRLAEEADRLKAYIPTVTEPKLWSMMNLELIVTHAQSLLDMDSGLSAMFRDNRIEDIRRLFNLFCRVNSCVEMFREYTGRYIVKCGMEIISGQEEAKDPIAFVRAILELKAKFDVIIRDACRNEKKMVKQLKDSFETFVNKDNRCSASLAAYVDELLKSNSQAATESEIEGKLDQALVIFRYLSDKDVFESFYRKHLCKRLLSNRSSSDENEKFVISRLKTECGYQFTSKLEGMLLDMNISKTAMVGFRPNASSCDLEVTLLTAGHWPLTPSPQQCRLPAQLTQAMSSFRAFYTERNSGRKLTWLLNSGSIDIKVRFSLLFVVAVCELMMGCGNRLTSLKASVTLRCPSTKRASCSYSMTMTICRSRRLHSIPKSQNWN